MTGDGSLDAVLYFEGRREALKRAAIDGGGRAVVAMIAESSGFAERLVLYTLARQVLVMAQDVPNGLDAAIAVADAGIDEVEDLLPEVADAEQRRHLLRALHMLNFNLAADLADCWPDDDAPRERRHFERGLEAGEALLSPVFAGAVTPHVLANDCWVKGMHQLSLGDPSAAHTSWARAEAAAAEAARREGKPEKGRDSTLQVILIRGYLGICNYLRAPPGRHSRLEAASRMLNTAVWHLQQRQANADEAGEAAYFVAQLEKVRSKYAPNM
jgi:hypothetical protein